VEYSDILPNLALSFGPGKEFDAKSVSLEFKRVGPDGLPVQMSKRYAPKFFEAGKISGDLDRLYRMNLLRRKSTVRLFTNPTTGRIFGRGRKYLYQFTRQGWKYTTYLGAHLGVPPDERPRMDRKRPSDPMDIFIKSRLPEEGKKLMELTRAFEYDDERPIFKRFPRRYGPQMMDEFLLTKGMLENESRKSRELYDLANRAMNLAKDIQDRRSESPTSPPAAQPRQPPSGLQLLIDSRDYFISRGIDPIILIDEVPQPSFGISPYATIPLLGLIYWAIANLKRLGYE
jgi:hypothetical protein